MGSCSKEGAIAATWGQVLEPLEVGSSGCSFHSHRQEQVGTTHLFKVGKAVVQEQRERECKLVRVVKEQEEQGKCVAEAGRKIEAWVGEEQQQGNSEQEAGS